MSSRRRTTFRLLCSLAVFACVAATATHAVPIAQQASTLARTAGVMPRYDANRDLVLPEDYRQWVLVGSSLGLSYTEGARGLQMFNATLMEPGAYRHFVATGEFREGTMLALILQGIGTNATPARQGQFATNVHAVEMAVKDAARVPEGWAYYDFGGPMTGGYRATAAPQPKTRCYDCHEEHAARDRVFTQFYGLLNEARGTPP
jgi:hypothetical protein